MKSVYDSKNKLLTLKMTEEIDQHAVEKIRDKADYEIEKYMPQKVVFDFGQVSFMDSAGIGMIVGRYKTASLFGGIVNISNARPNIKKILEMSGILKIIPIIEGGKNE